MQIANATLPILNRAITLENFPITLWPANWPFFGHLELLFAFPGETKAVEALLQNPFSSILDIADINYNDSFS